MRFQESCPIHPDEAARPAEADQRGAATLGTTFAHAFASIWTSNFHLFGSVPRPGATHERVDGVGPPSACWLETIAPPRVRALAISGAPTCRAVQRSGTSIRISSEIDDRRRC
jgi:hypothetical protein